MRQAGALERFLRRRDRADAHVVGMNAGGGRGDDPRQRLELELLGLLRRRDQQGRGAVGKRR